MARTVCFFNRQKICFLMAFLGFILVAQPSFSQLPPMPVEAQQGSNDLGLYKLRMENRVIMDSTAPTSQEVPDSSLVVAMIDGAYKVTLSEILSKTGDKEKHLVVLRPENTKWQLASSLRDKELDQLIFKYLVQQEVKKQKIEVSDDEVVRKVAAFRGRFYSTDEKFNDYLQEKNLSREEFYENLREDIGVGKLLKKEIDDKVDVSESALKDFYNANMTKRFVVPEKMEVRRIDVLAKPGEMTKEEAYKKIVEIHSEIAQQMEKNPSLKDQLEIVSNFAREYSDGPNAKGGGFFILYGRGHLEPEFEKLCYETPVGKLSAITEMENGYMVILPGSRTNSIQRSFEDVKGEIIRSLEMEQKDKLGKDWYSRLENSHEIIIYPQHLYRNLPED